MSYIQPDIVEEVRKMDLLTYLKNYEPHELVRISNNPGLFIEKHYL